MTDRDHSWALGDSLAPALSNLRGLTTGFSADLGDAVRAMRAMDNQAGQLSRSLSSSLRTAFDRAVFGGQRLGDVLKGLASSVAGKALDAAIKPVTASLSNSVSGLVGGLTGAIGSAFGFADGAAFSAGRVRAFARGGVVGGPALFPMRGATGLMGEAGPEAIMPLSRGPDGRLGVAASGAPGGTTVVVNIATPDIAGFQRSRAQVSAQLARAVRRGQSTL